MEMMKSKTHLILVFLGLVAWLLRPRQSIPQPLRPPRMSQRLAALPIPLLFVIPTMERSIRARLTITTFVSPARVA